MSTNSPQFSDDALLAAIAASPDFVTVQDADHLATLLDVDEDEKAPAEVPKTETIIEIAEPKRPRLRLLLDRDTRVTEHGYWSMSGRKGSLSSVWSQRFAARVVLPEYVTIISTYEERRVAANS